MYPPRKLLQNTLNFLKKLTEFPQESFYWYDVFGIQKKAEDINTFHSEIFQARYAMKANSNELVLDTIKNSNIRIDACSEYEAYHAIEAGFSPSHVQVSSQQCPNNRKALYDQGISCVATSLNQLQDFCRCIPGGKLGIRVNPGQGSGQFKKINTGGNESSFGIRHEYIDQALEITQQTNVKIIKLHVHIGSGSDIQTWIDTFNYCLNMIDKFPDLTILNMGGGFKVARMPGEKNANLKRILNSILPQLEAHNKEKKRHIQIEIEPGSYLVAPYGYIVTKADDIVDTGTTGYTFVKTTTGMDMFLRPALYHAQHPIYHYSLSTEHRSTIGKHNYCFVGHCCESSDIITPNKNGGPGMRGFDQEIQRGDLIVIGGCGAYCESMRCKGYNGFYN